MGFKGMQMVLFGFPKALKFIFQWGLSINDVMLNFTVFGPPLSYIHTTYQYCLSRIG